MAGPPGRESTSFEHFVNVAFEYRLKRLRARAAAAAIWELMFFSNHPCHELLDGLSEPVAKALLKVTASVRFRSLAKGGPPAPTEIEAMLQRYPELLD